MKHKCGGRLFFFLCVILIVSTTAAYWQVHSFDFINYDDPVYVTENPHVLAGLTWDGVKWAFTSMHGSNWFPLTWLSLMLDRTLFGTEAGAFHLVNVGLHIVNTVLLFVLLLRCTKDVWPSFFAAAVFALHPLHVESVAWVTERKDVLSTVFWFLTMLAYVRYAQRPKLGRYMLMIVFFVLGLMSKPMLVTLPFVLLLLDYWPLGRLRRTEADVAGKGKSVMWLLLEKAPLFALAVVSCVVTLIAQSKTVSGFEVFSLSDRLTNTIVAYGSYISKMFRPTKLAIFYPHPQGAIPVWQVAVSAAALLVISVVVFMFRRKQYLVTGWLWYLGTLVPVIGLVQVGAQAMADRYTYIPLTGLFIMIGWAIKDVVSGKVYLRGFAVISGLGVCAILSFVTFRQVGYWRDSAGLFDHALDVTSGNYVAHCNLGIVFAEQENIEKAMEHFQAALAIWPNDADSHYNMGKSLVKLGRSDEAIGYFGKVLEIRAGDPDTYSELAMLHFDQGRSEQAIVTYQKGIELSPESGLLHSGLGLAFLRMRRLDEAIAELAEGIRLEANSETYVNLGMAVSLKGELGKAMECYEKAIRLNPKNAEAYYNLGNASLAQGKLCEVIEQYGRAIEIRDDYVKAHGNLAVALAQQGKLDEAIESFKRVLELEPNSPDAHFNIASTYFEKGDVSAAVLHLKKVVELVPQDVGTRCMLAELLLQQGNIEPAISEYRQALKLNPNYPRAQAGLNRALKLQSELNSGKQ